jgi:multiple sugar transport system substrate-binding protein
MNHMKTIAKGVSTFALTVALGGTATAQDWSTELGDHSGVTIRVQSIADPFIDAFDEISPGFTELTGAEVALDSFGYDPLHEKQILSCSQGSDEYDVLFIDGIWAGEFAEAGCLDPVEERVAAANPDVMAMDDYIDSVQGTGPSGTGSFSAFRLRATGTCCTTARTCSNSMVSKCLKLSTN